MDLIFRNKFLDFVRYLLSLLVSLALFVSVYINFQAYINEKTGNSLGSRFVIGDKLSDSLGNNINRGLRTPKIKVKYSLPGDIASETEYKDVKFISTKGRPFSQKEIDTLKLILDSIPQKLFDYRPWAIISSDFSDSSITRVNPEGVAFSSGPYIYVGDITFKKQLNFDTGTFRGLRRILAHEITHTAQFFETTTIPPDSSTTFLDSSPIVQNWIVSTGWVRDGEIWSLNKSEQTTDYGKTNPVEDMADSVGAMVIGEESSLSQDRIDWVINWLGINEVDLLKGTIPLSENVKQRKVDSSDEVYLQKYKDIKALDQDVMNFQSIKTISKKDFSNFYLNEFKKRGWTGYSTLSGKGEFKYGNIYKVNLEMDDNPLRVATMILTVYSDSPMGNIQK